MPSPYFNEIFQYPIKQFKQHLELENNSRIIFSGKFGTGKTRFLEDFFNAEHQQTLFGEPDKYNVFRLSPVNYSISPTEDIINYIKYDIIFDFLKKGFTFDEQALDFLRTLPLFIRKHLDKTAMTFIKMVPELGKTIAESYDTIKGLIETFKKYQNEINQTESDPLANFLETTEQASNSIYTNDILIQLIRKIVVSRSKKSILIIDDLERLDPEHFFRILNVFSAHLTPDHDGLVNKFGFSKIILVCDYQNLKSLFHYRYGEEADFIGYMDKFYSTEVFHFDNKPAIVSIVNNIVETLQFESYGSEARMAKSVINVNGFIASCASLFAKHGLLSLRTILRLYEKPVDFLYGTLEINNIIGGMEAFKIPICPQFKLLANIVGDAATLVRLARICKDRNCYLPEMNAIFGFLLVVITYHEHQFHSNHSAQTFACIFNQQKYSIKINSVSTGMITQVSTNNYTEHPTAGKIVGDPVYVQPGVFWNAMIAAIEKLRSIGYIV